MDLQLTHLHTLEAVARHGSFSRAARELGLTQPAVSMQVRQLERDLGLPLLERVGKRTYTTKAGEVLLAHAGRALSAAAGTTPVPGALSADRARRRHGQRAGDRTGGRGERA